MSRVSDTRIVGYAPLLSPAAGVMLESFIVAGSQKPGSPATLTYGQSVTDACTDIAMTESALDTLAAAVQARRALKA
jgi:phospho-2-dehydro-3-deoxyheptonate aldolase